MQHEPCDMTVAIATMDRPEAIRRCVEALLAGQRLPAEIIIVDQSTADTTRDLVAASDWQTPLPIRYLRDARQGLAASRNRAIDAATCPVIVFTDDDCVPDAGWIAALAETFGETDGPDVVTGPILPLGPDEPGRYAISTRASRVRACYQGRALPWEVGSGANTAVRREWLARIEGFDERLGAGSPGRSAEDLDLLYRLLRAGAKVVYEPSAIVFHERADSARRLATRPAYGFGMGAFCALWAHRHDPYAAWMLTRWAADRVYALGTSCVRRRWRRVHEELLMLRGAASGFAHAFSRWSS